MKHLYLFAIIGSLFLFGVSNSLFSQTITDVDGNTYSTIQIGSQLWMAENLRTTKLNNGTPILNVTDNTIWSQQTSGAYCWFNNDTINKQQFGALYNWMIVNTGNICPTDWHVPTDQDWKILETQLGLSTDEVEEMYWRGNQANELKSVTGWINNSNGNNSTGFSAKPSGYRDSDGEMGTIGDNCIWWTSSAIDEELSVTRSLNDSDNKIGRFDSENIGGYSIRCIKD
jgi:uncharacterized protein (TIGR02145 family)